MNFGLILHKIPRYDPITTAKLFWKFHAIARALSSTLVNSKSGLDSSPTHLLQECSRKK